MSRLRMAVQYPTCQSLSGVPSFRLNLPTRVCNLACSEPCKRISTGFIDARMNHRLTGGHSVSNGIWSRIWKSAHNRAYVSSLVYDCSDSFQRPARGIQVLSHRRAFASLKSMDGVPDFPLFKLGFRKLSQEPRADCDNGYLLLTQRRMLLGKKVKVRSGYILVSGVHGDDDDMESMNLLEPVKSVKSLKNSPCISHIRFLGCL